MNKRKRTAIQQLDTTLKRFRPLLDTRMPQKGWIRAIRDALGMNGRQLADRLNVTRQRVDQIENDELKGSATIRSMRRIAECLDCAFVYAFVPRISLQQIVRDQAVKIAKERLARASVTMGLEDQGLNAKENARVLAEMVEDLVDTMPSNMWDRQI